MSNPNAGPAPPRCCRPASATVAQIQIGELTSNVACRRIAERRRVRPTKQSAGATVAEAAMHTADDLRDLYRSTNADTARCRLNGSKVAGLTRVYRCTLLPTRHGLKGGATRVEHGTLSLSRAANSPRVEPCQRRAREIYPDTAVRCRGSRLRHFICFALSDGPTVKKTCVDPIP